MPVGGPQRTASGVAALACRRACPRVTAYAAATFADRAYYGSRHSLADQGDLGVPGESGALVEPPGACLVPSSPVQPVAFVAGRSRDGAGIGEQVLDLRDGERDHAGVGGRRLVRADRFRCLRIGSVAQQGSGDGADRQGGHDQDEMPGDGCVQPDLGLVQSEAVLTELEIFFYGPAQPGGADQPGLGDQLALGYVAVAEGQVTGPEVTADKQVVPRRGGPGPRPRVPPVALGALPGGADLPQPPVLGPLARQQAADRLGAGHGDPAGQGEGEVRRDAQHVSLPAGFEELPQLRAVAVHLVRAGEIERDAVTGGVLADVGG